MSVTILNLTFAILSVTTGAVAHTSKSNLTLRVADSLRGLLTLSFEPWKNANESISIVDHSSAGFQPNWVSIHQDKIYSISRSQYPDEDPQNGGLFEFVRSTTGNGHRQSSLQLLNSTSADGFGGVYVDVSRDGQTLAAADIDGSTVSIHPLVQNGEIGNASHVFTYHLEHPGPGANGSQLSSNPHQSIFEPSGRYMFVPDRGADRLYVYDTDGPYNVTLVRNISLPLGTGPRHLTFRPHNGTRTFAYLVSELDNTVRVFSLDGIDSHGFLGVRQQNLQIELLQVASTLEPNSSARSAPDNRNMAAEVSLSNDGRYAYVSNRNTVSLSPDTLTVYAVDPASIKSHLTWVGQSSTHGKIPRHFSLSSDPQSKYIAVANEISQMVIILQRDEHTGLANHIVGNLTLGKLDPTEMRGPICVVWDSM